MFKKLRQIYHEANETPSLAQDPSKALYLILQLQFDFIFLKFSLPNYRMFGPTKIEPISIKTLLYVLIV